MCFTVKIRRKVRIINKLFILHPDICEKFVFFCNFFVEFSKNFMFFARLFNILIFYLNFLVFFYFLKVFLAKNTGKDFFSLNLLI